MIVLTGVTASPCSMHVRLIKLLDERIGDKGVLRLIEQGLAAGVIEDGNWAETPESSS